MSDETSGSDVEEMEIELPPALVQFLNEMRAEQTKLRKDKAFENPVHLRKFIALNLMERLFQLTEMLGTTMYDTHQLAVSNAIQLQRMRKWTGKHLRKLGAEVNDGEPFGGEDVQEHINVFGQAFYALGSYLQKKYPEDRELEATFNALALAFNALVQGLMGDQSVEDDDDDDDDDGDGGDAHGELEPSDPPAGPGGDDDAGGGSA